MAPEDTVSVGRPGEFITCSAAEVKLGARLDKDGIKSDFLRLLPDLIQHVAKVLLSRNWGIIFSDTPAFLTSDHPVILRRGKATKANFGFGTPGTEILFPISPQRLLAITDDWPSQCAHYKLAKPDLYNEIITARADRFVFWNQHHPCLVYKMRTWRRG